MNKHMVFPALALLGGGAAFFLRLLQNRTGFDPATGLPISGNLYALALGAVLAVWALGLVWWVRRLPRNSRRSSFPGAFAPAGTGAAVILSCGLLALLSSGFLDIFAALASPSALLDHSGLIASSSGTAAWDGLSGPVRLIPGIMSVLCGLCLFPAVSALRVYGKRQESTLSSELLLIPVVALVVRLVIFYRLDSVNPALMAYYPELLALVLLILAFFRLASFPYVEANSRGFTWFTAMAVILCMTALADAAFLSEVLFWGGMAVTLTAFLALLRDIHG